MKIAAVDMREAASRVTVRVRLVGLRRVRARLWLGGWLLRLAMWVLPMTVVVEEADEPAGPA